MESQRARGRKEGSSWLGLHSSANTFDMNMQSQTLYRVGMQNAAQEKECSNLQLQWHISDGFKLLQNLN